MADMDFDILYLVQTPFFYLGNPQKALEQLATVEIDAEDKTGTELWSFQTLWALAASNNMENLRSEMQRMVTVYESLVRSFALLMQINQGKSPDLTYYHERVEAVTSV